MLSDGVDPIVRRSFEAVDALKRMCGLTLAEYRP
jgi:hypothetical protein